MLGNRHVMSTGYLETTPPLPHCWRSLRVSFELFGLKAHYLPDLPSGSAPIVGLASCFLGQWAELGGLKKLYCLGWSLTVWFQFMSMYSGRSGDPGLHPERLTPPPAVAWLARTRKPAHQWEPLAHLLGCPFPAFCLFFGFYFVLFFGLTTVNVANFVDAFLPILEFFSL